MLWDESLCLLRSHGAPHTGKMAAHPGFLETLALTFPSTVHVLNTSYSLSPVLVPYPSSFLISAKQNETKQTTELWLRAIVWEITVGALLPKHSAHGQFRAWLFSQQLRENTSLLPLFAGARRDGQELDPDATEGLNGGIPRAFSN